MYDQIAANVITEVRALREENEVLRDCLAQFVKATEWDQGKRPHNLSTIGRAYWRARWLLAAPATT